MAEFEFWPDPITDYGVSCPLTSEKSMYNVVTTLMPSVLTGSSSFLQVIINKDTHTIFDGFEIQQDGTRDLGVICP